MKIVFSSDQHLTGYVPTCRIETRQEWLEYQFARLCEVVDYANTKDADLVIGGDLFDTPRVDDEIITIFLQAIRPLLNTCYIIGGNHSLPYHREANISQSSLGILVAASSLMEDKIRYCVCEEQLVDGRFQHSYRLTDDITIVHTLCFEKEDDVPFGARATYVDELIKEFKTPWVLVGDLHQSYHREISGHHVLSSGCLTAQTVREKDMELGVWFIDTGNTVDVSVPTDTEPMYRIQKSVVQWLPIIHNPENVSTIHLKPKKDDDALKALVEVLNNKDGEVSIDILRNLLYYMETNAIQEGVQAIIEEVIYASE